MQRFGRNFAISCWPGRPACTAGLVVVILAMGGCASSDTAASGPPHEAIGVQGTILAMRPVQPGPADEAADGTVIRSLERTANAGVNASAMQTQGTAIDFVVREAGGATIAVVQTNEQHFQVGDTVAILRGDHTRLSRPGI